ncbi:uncharacterized protein LOC125868602 [Solanum stenotomum]|uniref:uncharacterized protein LOC125868602 n=1 Tax=Solanum stenotomum TaxID=172797 RepID=UPI0020D0BDBF|nr:uncharacterized protein LOC125868602 [Solanum stenotomum]
MGTSSYDMVFGKACHLPPKFEDQVYWVIKKLNLELELAGKRMIGQLHELEEFRLHVYKNAKIYKENMKKGHGQNIIPRTFDLNQQGLLFNLQLQLFLRKLRSKWSGPFEVVRMTPHGAMELQN